MKTLFNFLIVFLLFIKLSNAQTEPPEMVYVEGGTFKMGINESKYYDEFPVHQVTLNSYYIGKYEVTIGEYKGFCNTAGLDLPSGEDFLPITDVSWEEAVMFCNWLSRLHHLDKCYKITREEKKKTFKVTFDKTANGYRLPTEAEWEYAARGGINMRNLPYSGSTNASDVAWYIETGRLLHPGGEKAGNELDIYDMTGNAQEWCYDVYVEKYYENSPKENPVCEKGAVVRVSRGGNYNGFEETLRVTKRFYNNPDHKDATLGIRIVRNK